jgi:hypothetical protein
VLLRPYQVRARAAAKQAYADGKRAILYVAPTGAGKTVILGDTVTSHVRRQPSPRVNLFAHRRELLTQTADTFRRFGLEVGIFGEGAHHAVQVLSTQAALSRGEVTSCTLAVFDEAHHYAADEWGELLTAYRDRGVAVCGATATPERGDGRALDKFDHLVVVAQVRELVALWRTDPTQGLVPYDIIKPTRKPPKGKIATSPVKAYQRYGDGRRNVVFCPNLKAAREWCEEFAAVGISSAVVWGNQDADSRDAALRSFRAGEVRVLLNVFVLTEGWDCPEVGVVTIARTCGSAGMLVQMCGRGARPAAGKADCRILDLAAVTSSLGRPDDDCTYSLDGVGMTLANASGIVGQRLCKACKKPIDADVCGYCGKDNGQEVPGDAGIELEHWSAVYAADPVDVRVARLRKWIIQGRARGLPEKSAIGLACGKFKGTYKQQVPSGFVSQALGRTA